MISRRCAAAVAGALISLVATTGCGYQGLRDLPLPGGPDVGDQSYTVKVTFDDVLNLTEQSTVRSDGVVIGRVEAIERQGWKAVATLRLRDDVPLPRDVQASVSQTSLLGEKFVDLSPEPDAAVGADRLGDGDRIGTDRSGHGAEVEEVLGAISLLLNGGGIAELKTISRELHGALETGGVDTRTFLRELDTFVATLDRNQSTIISALESVDRLSRQVDQNRDVVRAALDEVPAGIAALADQEKQLTKMLTSLDRFSEVGSDVVQRSADDLAADLAALRPVLAELEKSGDHVPQALETILSFPFPDEVLNAVHGDYVNLAVRLDLSLLDMVTDVTGGVVDVAGQDDPAPLTGDNSAANRTQAEVGDALTELLAPSNGQGLLGLLLGGGLQ